MIETYQTNGARLMPMRVLSLLIPASGWDLFWIPIQGVFAWVFAAMASMNMANRWMWYGVGFHMFTTILIVSFVPEKSGDRNIKKDALVKASALLLAWLLGKEPGLQFQVSGISLSAGALFAGYYLCGEWIGVTSDFKDLKVRFFPKWAPEVLQQASDSIDSADIGSKVASMFTSVQKQPDGSIKTVQNATTIVTTPPPDKPEAPIV